MSVFVGKIPRGLYAITDESLGIGEEMFSMVEAALQGGAVFLQLRDKTRSDEVLLSVARRLKALCDEYGALFIVNDRIDLALESDAHGVHLGKDDGDVVLARKVLGKDKIIGVSCYDELDRAKAMKEQGADYVAFGSFFPSPTKPNAVRASISLLRQAKSELCMPVCAIGGITPENAKELIEAGADMLAVISALWGTEDVSHRASVFSRLFSS